MSALLELRGIVKRYGAVLALDRVDFDVARGEVHALVGENGAGKSTLMKILAGAVPRDAGSVLVDGTEAVLDSPADSQRLGIGMIHQDLKIVPEMTVAENLLLGAEPLVERTPFIDRRAMERTARAALAQLGEVLDPAAKAGRLGVARQQIVEIARAISRKVRVLALDEPTAPLTGREIARLFDVVRRLRGEGAGIVYISHRLDEVFEIADRVTVLRDGRTVASAPASTIDRATLVRWMVGREITEGARTAERAPGEEILRLEEVAAGGLGPVTLRLHRGEILGLAGLVGAGRTELARLIFGADRAERGRMLLEGKVIAPRSPREAIDLGIALLTEDRNRLGLVPTMGVRENVTLADLRALGRGIFTSRRREAVATKRHVDRLRIRTPSLDTRVDELSGGNRQKVVLARWLEARSKVLIFDEPTAGVDVAAKAEILALVRELAAGGAGVIVISSDLPELLGLSDRVLVLCSGRIAGDLAACDATPERVMSLATGGGSEAA
ncbi:MAG: sugar ABC transporter ATP-binding protein [Acidobacteriia bacterium]|nr:sugar ABC transporter ATP-binding protein [Terriglobia bacterium]